MVAVSTVLIVLGFSLIAVRVATVGLSLTGISKDLAQFQALSAFTCSGFTTKESEEIVNHPVRRKIIMHLMLLGNAGIVIAMSSILLSFINTDSGGIALQATEIASSDSFGPSSVLFSSRWMRFLVLVTGIGILWTLANSQHVDRVMWKFNSWTLSRWMRIEIHDYTRLLRLARDYIVCDLTVRPDSWLTGRTLAETELSNEGILVLGIEHADGSYLGTPRGRTIIRPGDQLILYGLQESMIDLESRTHDLAGNLHHIMAVTRQQDVLEKEKSVDDRSENRNEEKDDAY